MVHNKNQGIYLHQKQCNKLDALENKLDQQFETLKMFIESKDRKHPSTFIVFSAEKSTSKTEDTVIKATKQLYELFLQDTNVSSLSYFLQNKVCDLYLICESCNQMQGRTTIILIVLIITNIMFMYR